MDYFIEYLIILLILISLTFYLYLIWNFNYWKKRGVKGPKPKIYYGNFENSFKMKRHLQYELQDLYEQYKYSDKFVGVFMGKCPQLLLIDPKLIREILVTNFKSFQDNEISLITTDSRDPLLARNPFLSIGQMWKDRRAEVTPGLTPNRIKNNYSVMRDVYKRLHKYLEKNCGNPPEVRELIMRYTTEVVIICIYGIDAGAFDDDNGICRIQKEGNSFTIFATTYYNLISAIPFLKYFYKIKLVPKYTEEFFKNLSKNAMKIKQETNDNRIDYTNYLLQIKEKKNLTDLDIAAHSITFFLDGFDTAAILISHVLHMVARYKNVQNKLREEISEIVSENGDIEFDKLLELSYLDQVFNETLRLFPPLNILTKLCTKRYEFINSNNKSVFIEEGTVVIVPTYSVHRDERYYPEPNSFIPERFNPENGGAKKFKDMGVFLPFSDGPRVCLGMRFGLAQSKTVVAHLIYNWEISVNEKTKSGYIADPERFMYTLDGGLWLDFKKIMHL